MDLTNKPEFTPFPKIPRFSRDIIITEKIDGTNAQIFITDDGNVFAGSRTRWLDTFKDGDNYGFAKWVEGNKQDLLTLGPGQHFGEWWGHGIQRGYGLKEKRFSLFNVSRWNDENKPACCHIVPTLHKGVLKGQDVEDCLTLLRIFGSFAAVGYDNPEGIIIYHTGRGDLFKKTLKDDERGKEAG